jgi:acyl dehydratase
VVPVAALGLEARNRSPVFPNDTLRVETTLVQARASRSRPGRVVLVFEDKAFNQRGELVIEMRRSLMFERPAKALDR